MAGGRLVRGRASHWEQTGSARCLRILRICCREKPMFEDSLIESGGRLKTKRGATTVVSFVLQALLVGVLVLLPLIFTEALPKQQLMTFLVAPPPPPPPPPPPAAAPVRIVKQIQSNLVNGQLRTPTKIP